MVFVFKTKPNRQGRKRIHICHLDLLEHGFPSLNELSEKYAERSLPDTRYVHWRSLVPRQGGARIRAARSIRQAIPGYRQPKIAPCAKGDVPASPWNERTLPSRQGYGIQRAAESQGPGKRLQRLGFSPVAPSEGFLSACPQAGALRGDRSGIRHEQGMYGTGQHILIIGSLPPALRNPPLLGNASPVVQRSAVLCTDDGRSRRHKRLVWDLPAMSFSRELALGYRAVSPVLCVLIRAQPAYVTMS